MKSDSFNFRNSSLVEAYYSQVFDSLEKLGCNPTKKCAEDLACFLLRTMGSESRDYHKPEHSLDISKNLMPVGQLAALFHDLVYVQVDPSWETSLKEHLFPFVPNRRFELNVLESLNQASDEWLNIIAELFGLQNETELTPQKGLNEFLSAIVFYRKTKSILNAVQMVTGIACIEATIPFRNIDTSGLGPAERLSDRITKIRSRNLLQDVKCPLDTIIHECKLLVLNDLGSFGEKSFGKFLSNTWNVMIENYPALRNHYYLVSEYRKALHGNIRFFSSLNPNYMYWSDQSSNEELITQTKRNLRDGIAYLKSIAIATTFIESIALQSGGDAPLELFVGQTTRSREHKPKNISNYLPEAILENPTSDRVGVFEVLKNGRSTRSRFDHKASPLGALIYAKFNSDIFEHLFELSFGFQMGSVSPSQFTASFPRELSLLLTKAVAKIATTRSEKIMALASI